MGNLVEFKKRDNPEDAIGALCVNCFRMVDIPPEWEEVTNFKELVCPHCSTNHIQPMYKEAAEAVSAFRELYDDGQAWMAEAKRMLEAANNRDTLLLDFIRQSATIANRLINDPVVMGRIGPEVMARYHHMVTSVVNLVSNKTGIIDITPKAGDTANSGEGN